MTLHVGQVIYSKTTTREGLPAKQCKRTSSQVLLYDWPAKDGGPTLDIDF